MDNAIDLTRLWSIVKRSFVPMIVLAIVGAVVGYVGAKVLITPKYTAETTLLVNRKTDSTDAGTEYTAQQADIQLITTYKGIITSPTILSTAAKNLTEPQKVMTKKATKAVYGKKYDAYTDTYSTYTKTKAQPAKYKLVPAKYRNLTESDLTSMVSVTSDTDSQLFTINVEDTSAKRSADIANEVASVFKTKIGKIMSVKNVTVMSKAHADYSPTSPNLKLVALIGAVLGIVIGFAWGFIREITDRTVKDLSFITDDLGLTNLGVVNYVHHTRANNDVKQSKPVEPEQSDSQTDNRSLTSRSRRNSRRI